MNRIEAYFVALVFAHLAVVLVHTVAHLVLQILPPPPDTAFILAVILIGPVATLPILRFSRPLASGVLAVVMIAAFAYGFQSHFLASGADQVSIVASDPWTFVFFVTAIALGILELAGLIVAIVLFAGSINNPSARPGQPS
jgi:hypothetical protein